MNFQLTPSTRVVIESQADGSQSLTIKKVKTDDIGFYVCVAVNSEGEMTESVSLDVNRK